MLIAICLIGTFILIIMELSKQPKPRQVPYEPASKSEYNYLVNDCDEEI